MHKLLICIHILKKLRKKTLIYGIDLSNITVEIIVIHIEFQKDINSDIKFTLICRIVHNYILIN